MLDVSPDSCIMLEDCLDNFSFDFYACDYDKVKLALNEINWDSVLQADSVDSALTSFYNQLYVVSNDFVPRKKTIV